MTRVDDGTTQVPGESFASYTPVLDHLSSAFTSCAGYVILFVRVPKSLAEWQAAVILVGTAAIMWYIGKKDAERRAAADAPWSRPPGLR